LAALPLAPVLYPQLFPVLVVLRPSLGVLLAGAILARDGGILLPAMLGLAISLQLLWVWLYFPTGKAWQSEIDSDDKLPFITARLLQPRQVRRLRRLLRARGARFAVLARFAIFPTGLLAAAGGASDLPPRRFFSAGTVALLAACGLAAAPVTAWAWHSGNSASGSRWQAWPGWWHCRAR
jgi:membrane protein DedA with SNARE-associated domain